MLDYCVILMCKKMYRFTNQCWNAETWMRALFLFIFITLWFCQTVNESQVITVYITYTYFRNWARGFSFIAPLLPVSKITILQKFPSKYVKKLRK